MARRGGCVHGIESLRAQFRERTGYDLNLEAPRTYCEKIQWRKVNDRRTMLPRYADKIAAREIVAERIGTDHLVPSPYSCYREPSKEEIKAYMLEPCVIKAAHGCAWEIFQGAGGQYLDAKQVRARIDTWLSSTYGADKLQWADSQIQPGVLVEQTMSYRGGQPPLVKLYVFDGVARIGKVIEHGKHTATTRAKPKSVTWHDRDGTMLEIRLSHIPAAGDPAPAEYTRCVDISEWLGSGIDHVRVDWLLTDEGVRFSEFEWYPTSGMFRFEPPEWDRTMGAWWTLPQEGL